MSKRGKSNRPAPMVFGPLRARVSRGPRDDGRYYWRIQRDGQANGSLWALPEELATALVLKLANPAPTKPARAAPGVPRTFGELAHIWLEKQENRSDIAEKTLRCSTHAVRRLCRVAGAWKLQTFKHKFSDIRDAYGRQGAAPTTTRVDLKVARRIIRFGALRDWCTELLPRVPVRGPEPPRPTPTAKEAMELFGYLRKDEYRIAYLILRRTGCRGIALERLQWSDVNWRRNTVVLTGKGMRKRKIPIPKRLVEPLREWWSQCGESTEGPVFHRQISIRLRIAVRRECERIDLEPFGLHGLRRLRVRELRRAGVTVTVAADLLGHSPQVMLESYDRSEIEERRDAMALVDLDDEE